MAANVYGPVTATVVEINSFDLSGGPFNSPAYADNNFILKELYLTFSTDEIKNITIHNSQNILIYDSGFTSEQTIHMFFNAGFNSGDNLILSITKTSNACVVNGYIKCKMGGTLSAENSILQNLQGILLQLTDKSSSPKTIMDKLHQISIKTDELPGEWNYISGTSGQALVPDGGKLIGASAISAGNEDGYVTINGGSPITIPKGIGWSLEPKASLISPVLVFVNTSTFMVEYTINGD